MNDALVPSGFKLARYDVLGSTNDEAKKLAREGAPDGTVIWARKQTQGRGRYGREWVSEEGNLFFSILCREEKPVDTWAQLSFVSALAVRDSIKKSFPEAVNVGFKWPNDVLVNERKAAGILLESGNDWLVVGIGVNVESYPRAGMIYPATSMKEAGAKGYALEALLKETTKAFARYCAIWRKEGFEPIRRMWLEGALHVGEAIEVRTAKETIAGVFKTLDAKGTLVLELENGAEKRVIAGEY